MLALLFMSHFSKAIIKWYDEHKRDLPWRHTTNPYIIWISEIILQQTRVAQGYDYFVRFIGRFPTVESLALASEDEVLKYWQGLGYYSRARNLHTAAKSMNGQFPTLYKDVLALKGVGEYTAAAICSFAYNMPYAVVDGNVYRVLARYLDIDTPIDSTIGKKTFAALADELMDKSNPAIYNQAIMDFGALQCTPQSPLCSLCPLVETCMAYSKNKVANLPVKQGKIKTSNRYLNYFYVRMGNYTFIYKRAANDIWRNLYEFPLIETELPISEVDVSTLSDFRQLFCNIPIESVSLLQANVKHVLSHRILYVNFYEVVIHESLNCLPQFLKIHNDEIEQYPVPKLIHSFIEKYI